MAANTGKISREEILHLAGKKKDNRLADYPLTAEIEKNLARLLVSLNQLRQAIGRPMIVSSGYRPGHYNSSIGGAPHSLHKDCRACDFEDGDGTLKAWCMANLDVLRKAGLQMEHPLDAPTWLHLDLGTRPNVVFRK